jgi:hypothetical protein
VTETSAEPAWAGLKDEELLALRISDLGVRIEGSELEPHIAQLYEQLSSRGVSLRPPCYLGDEWFSPTGVPAIAIPFYLAHARLKALELRQMLDIEGRTPEEVQRLLRHESGHAIDHAYRLSARPDWQEVFGNNEADYDVETYTPRPYSRSFVQHLPNWYAQSHPDEDFAETFAVWVSFAPEQWRERYRGWKALEKLEYVDRLMQEVAAKPPLVRGGRRISDASKLKKTLGRYYAERRKLRAETFPDFYDEDLRTIFAHGTPDGEPAAHFMRRNRAALTSSLVQWTGQRKYTVHELLKRIVKRCRTLKLMTPRDTARLHFDVAGYLASLLTNHLYTGKFKRSV